MAATRTSTRTRKPATDIVAVVESEVATQPTETVEATPEPQPEPEVVETVEAPKAYLSTKAPTDLHVDFAAWLVEQTGVEVDPKTVQIVCVLRDAYQRSERNQQSLAARRQQADSKKAEREAAAKQRKMDQLAKLQAELGL